MVPPVYREKPQSCIDYVMRRDGLDLSTRRRSWRINGASSRLKMRGPAGAKRERERARKPRARADAIERRAFGQ